MPDFPKKLNKKQKERFLEMVPLYLLDVGVIRNYNNFGIALNHIIQGNICKDCKESYEDCNCEYCDDCLSNRCMCDIQSYDQLVNYMIQYLYFNFYYHDIVKFINSLATIYDRRFYDENRHKAYLHIRKINSEYFNTYYLRNPKKLIRKKKQ